MCLKWSNFKDLLVVLRKRTSPVEKETSELFTRTVQILDLPSGHSPDNKFKAVLDAGCHAGDLITFDVITALGLADKVQPGNEVLGVCLNGGPLESIGTIVLLWEGAGFYKIFETRFHVVEGNSLAWQVILGAKTCATHSLLTVGAFGGSKHQIYPNKGKEHSAEDAARRDQHKKDVAANSEKVMRDKAEKKAAKEQQQRGNGEGSSRNRH